MLEGTSSVIAYQLMPGHFIRDDIMCRVFSVSVGEDRTQILVEDGNGYRYALYVPSDAHLTIFHWSEDDWQAYRDM